MDTIFAEATAPGKAGVSVIRLSGPRAFEAGSSLCGSLPPSHRAALRVLRDPNGEVLDTALVLAFDKGASFTGETVVELQCHGSRAVVAAILSALGRIDGLRPAGPGEFTRRALENDRLDLTQVEGLADLVEAETEFQRQQAQKVLSGDLSRKVLEWRRHLVEAAALIEATLDFADEEVPVDVTPDVLAHMDTVTAALQHEVNGFGASERIRDGFEIAILGAPNAGKSTLLNAIARRDVALTSEIAGTTRDVIEVRADLKGVPVLFLDTAGLRETEDPLEAAGIARARDRAAEADLRVFLVGNGEDRPALAQDDDIVLVGKADQGQGDISGLTGQGVSDLIDRLTTILLSRVAKASTAIRDRHAQAMQSALSDLSESRATLTEIGDSVLAAEYLRRAIADLEMLIGRVDVDDLLGDIFSRFCIGK
ncbi:tRNA uridine-5-carboxymethylaminomethyl(34) synthesis GTPase MnmE [Palleronia pelagia]|uniref:tRNA modification GTPase MnmE n=1 Tax=Palleronia pelagia TaxID=387096 RepID=A0A1H8F007_9RHOB|nr:tRNA uridine-5-carboxymethylaminomethyl(34) synthesis GTPase MnmE [Palleronia pelagia]SEN24734.1 tRNA modification GTPase trmE [Palleronia pelagia]